MNAPRRFFALLGLLMALAFDASCAAGLLTQVTQRKAVSLNGAWHAIVDPYETGVTVVSDPIGEDMDIVADFRSPRRVLPGIQDGYNRKGLLSNQGVRKQARFTY